MAHFGFSNWQKIAEKLEDLTFNKEGLLEVEINSKTICIAKKGELLNACAAKCPHASAPFVKGFVDALGNIVCPHHAYKFDLKNGRNCSGEGYFLKVYKVELRENGVFVNLT